MGILRNPRYEIYCQCRAKGMTGTDALKEAGFKTKCDALRHRPEIHARISELLKAGAKRAELSRKQVLDRIFDDWELSRKLGQMSAALKAGELMGREMHHMFTERREIGGPGDFDNKSEEELRDIIKAEMKDLGWDESTDQVVLPDSSSIN